jgi:hypothetical protein
MWWNFDLILSDIAKTCTGKSSKTPEIKANISIKSLQK